MTIARISNIDSWCRCGRCGHKLFKILDKKVFGELPFIEVKCHSCKEINVVGGEKKYERKSS